MGCHPFEAGLAKLFGSDVLITSGGPSRSHSVREKEIAAAGQRDRQRQTAKDVARWWIEETAAALRANAQRLIY